MLLAGLTHDEHHADRFRQEATGREGEHLGRRPIEPLGVVDEADEGSIVRHLGQQPQEGQTDEEAIGRRTCPEAERRVEGIALGTGQPDQTVQHRCAELVQPGEGQLHLGFDPSGPCDPAPGRPPFEVVEQHGLADARLAAQHEHLAAAGTDLGQEPVQCLALLLPATQSRHCVTIGHAHHPALTNRRTYTAGPVRTG